MQIKGYPVRLPLDVALVFSANPEDYTARGRSLLLSKIASARRSAPTTRNRRRRHRHHQPGSWTIAVAGRVEIPTYMQEIVEQIAFTAREDKKVDKRSGVSQRLPISTMELVVSNAERRALIHGESSSCRVSATFTPRFPASRARSNSNTKERCAARIR